MNAFYLTIVVLGVAIQNVVRKAFSDKTNGKGSIFYAALLSFVAMLFFVALSEGFRWESGVFPYALGFAVSFAAANVFSTLAVSCGPLSLTALMVSYSLMIPTVYGLVFLNDPISFGLIPGLLLLVVSLFLINKKAADTTISFKWFIYAFLALVGNGMCSTTQKMHQVVYGNVFENEFMIIALAIVVLTLCSWSLVTERSEWKSFVRNGWWMALAGGIANGIVNMLVMLLNSKNFPVSLMFPIISAGGIVITFFVSKLIYREHLTKAQLWGFVCGVLSVILLNI